MRSSSRCQMLRTARLGRPGHASIYLSRFWHALCHVYICVRLAVLQKGPNISKASCHMLLLLLAGCQSKSDYCPLNISYLASAADRPPGCSSSTSGETSAGGLMMLYIAFLSLVYQDELSRDIAAIAIIFLCSGSAWLTFSK